MSKLDEIQNRLKPTSWRFTAWLIVFAIATGIIWANFANLEEVAVATGEVVPYGQVKVVQHLEGGIITEINVKEGDYVTIFSIPNKIHEVEQFFRVSASYY